MASIQKRGNGYRIIVSNGYRSDGSKIVETMTYVPDPGMTKRQIELQLEQIKVDFERDVRSGQNIKGKKMTLEELSKSYLEDTEPINDAERDVMSLTTWVSYRDNLKNRILPKMGHFKIGDIIPKHINDYKKEMRKDGSRKDGKPGGLSEATIKKDCSLVSSMLTYAVDEGLIPINPLAYSGRRKRSGVTKEYKVEYFTIEQTKWFLWALDNTIDIRHEAHECKRNNGQKYMVAEYTQPWALELKWRAYFYLALFVGDRRGENLALTWEDVNLDTGEVRIEKSTAYTDKKIFTKDTKTHQSRTPIVPPVVTAILRQWKTEQMSYCMMMGSKWVGSRGKDFDKNHIFTQDNGKQMHPTTPYHKFKKIIAIYNRNVARSEEEMIPPKATQHHLRHTAASILISNNMDARSVAGVLGHSNPTTTLNIYSYFFKTKNEEAASIMQNVLSAK